MMLSILLGAIIFSSCEGLMEGEGYCPTVYKVKFCYTMNILDVDAFTGKVGSVSLYVFDKQGQFVTVQTESGAVLADDNYTMVLDLPAGTYDFIAWCGLKDNNDFRLANALAPRTKEDDLVCSLVPGTRASSLLKKPLAPLWHGRVDNVVLSADQEGEKIVATVPLIKDVNTVRIILQHYKGKELSLNDFEFTITDNNGIMNWDNSLLPCDEIVYREWSKIPAEVSLPDAEQDSGEKTAVSSLVAELDVARLVKGQAPILAVSHPGDSKPILRLPLIDLLLVAKGEARRNMDDQEYLDRQDEYNIIFFLDDAGWYMNGGIWINSWHVIDFSSNVQPQ